MLKTIKEKSKPLKKKNVPILLVIFILATTFISYKFFSIGKNVLQISATNTSLLGQIHNFTAPYNKLKGENDGRTNILLLGVGGEGHDGAMLTDTIILFSIKYSQDQPEVALISIPRDLYVNLKDVGDVKINSIYALDKETNLNKNRIIQAVSNITSLPIHYYVQADFEGFAKSVDALGGIDINVEHSFIDSKYPTENFGYQTISFENGLNHLNGNLALKYARSRHGIVTDDSGAFEANDAARAKRQQQILYASKEKLMSLGTIANPKKINELLNILGDHVRTNFQFWEIIKMADLARNIDTSSINNNVLDDSPSGLLYSSSAPDGSFIFLPKTNNFSEIHHLCQNVFEPKTVQTETANIKILNGTSTPDLATEASAMISYDNLTIVSLDNAKKNDYNKSIIYDLSNGNKPNTVEFLKDRFNAKIIKTSSIPNDLQINDQSANIVIVIGKNFLQIPRYEY